MKYVGRVLQSADHEVLETLAKTMGMRHLGETSGIRGVLTTRYRTVFGKKLSKTMT
jgi:hypothetical protein